MAFHIPLLRAQEQRYRVVRQEAFRQEAGPRGRTLATIPVLVASSNRSTSSGTSSTSHWPPLHGDFFINMAQSRGILNAGARVSFAEWAVHGSHVNVRHAQFTHCGIVFATDGTFDPAKCNVENALLSQVVTAFSGVNYQASAVNLTVAGRYAYVLARRGLMVVDLDDPLRPRLVAELGAPDIVDARAVAVQFRYAFVTNAARPIATTRRSASFKIPRLSKASTKPGRISIASP